MPFSFAPIGQKKSGQLSQDNEKQKMFGELFKNYHPQTQNTFVEINLNHQYR
jgi:hypothetical protein